MRFNRSRNHSCKSAMRHAWGRACSFVTKKIPYGRFDRPIIRLSSHRRVQRRFARSMMGGGDAPEEESGNYDSALRQLSLSESRRGVMESFLEQYSGSSWVCYWDGSFGPPRDPASTYVFRPALGQTNSGFVSKESLVSTFVQVASEPEVRSAAEELLRMQDLLKQRDVWCCAFGSESDFRYVPMLLPWPPSEGPIRPEGVLRLLGAHPQLLSSISDRSSEVQWDCSRSGGRSEEEGQEGQDEDDDGDHLLFQSAEIMTEVQKLLSRSSPTASHEDSSMKPLVFYAGSEKLNPVPFFVLGPISPGLIGGFMSALVHT